MRPRFNVDIHKNRDLIRINPYAKIFSPLYITCALKSTELFSIFGEINTIQINTNSKHLCWYLNVLNLQFGHTAKCSKYFLSCKFNIFWSFCTVNVRFLLSLQLLVANLMKLPKRSGIVFNSLNIS